MTLLELVSTLRRLDVRLWVDGAQLRASAPKGALTPELRNAIAEQKIEIIAFLQAAQFGVPSPIKPVLRNEHIPLSSSQQRIWFLQQLHPDSPAYAFTMVKRITMHLDVQILIDCLTEVVRRHEILRTTFKIVETSLVQVISPPQPFQVQLSDLQQMPEDDRKAEIGRWVAQESARPFDLAQGPLMRAKLLRVEPDDFVFLLAAHHIVSDQVSFDILQKEIFVLYEAFIEGKPSPLPEPPIQYADYAVWQQQVLKDELVQKQLDFWKNRLSGNLPTIELPALSYSFEAGRRSARLSRNLSHALVALAQQQNTSLFITILAAFKILLSRFLGQDDIIVGAPVTGRNRLELEQLIGRFTNTVVLRTDLSGNPSFHALLRRVEETTVGAYSNQDAPFEQVVEALHPTRNLNRNPVFDVLVSFLPQDLTVRDDPVLVSDLAALTDQEVAFPIVLSIEPTTEWIDLVFVFQQALFSGERIQSLLEQFVSLLEQIIANPNRQIESYSLTVPSVQGGLLDTEIALEQKVSAEVPVYPPEPDPSGGTPSDLIEESLRDIWEKLLKRDNIGVKDDFFALGGHSLMAVRMLAQIQEALGVHLPLTSLFQGATIQHLASLIRELAEPKRWSSLVEIQSGGNKPPFFCVHGLTGDVFWFHGLVQHMNPVQPFWGIQSVGLDGIEQPLKTIESMAAHYIYEMRRRQPEGPYYVGGYSFGGSVAYEMARQLALQGQKTALLVIIDQAAPQSADSRIRLSLSLILSVLQNVPYRVLDFLHQRPDQILARFNWLGRSFRKKVIATIDPHSTAAQQMTASDLIDYAIDLPAQTQRIIEINHNAISDYVPGGYPGVVTLLSARHGRVRGNHDKHMGWGDLASRVDIKEISGSHVQMFRKPHIRLLAQQLQSCLDRAQADNASERHETAPGT